MTIWKGQPKRKQKVNFEFRLHRIISFIKGNSKSEDLYNNDYLQIIYDKK